MTDDHQIVEFELFGTSELLGGRIPESFVEAADRFMALMRLVPDDFGVRVLGGGEIDPIAATFDLVHRSFGAVTVSEQSGQRGDLTGGRRPSRQIVVSELELGAIAVEDTPSVTRFGLRRPLLQSADTQHRVGTSRSAHAAATCRPRRASSRAAVSFDPVGSSTCWRKKASISGFKETDRSTIALEPGT